MNACRECGGRLPCRPGHQGTVVIGRPLRYAIETLRSLIAQGEPPIDLDGWAATPDERYYPGVTPLAAQEALRLLRAWDPGLIESAEALVPPRKPQTLFGRR